VQRLVVVAAVESALLCP